MTGISGLPLETARQRLREQGIENVRVEIICGREELQKGELRALRFRDGTLLAARFPAARKGTDD